MCQSRRHTNVPEMSDVTSGTYIQERLRLKSASLSLTLSGQRIFPKMLNTCSHGAVSAKYFLASLESTGKFAPAVF